MASDLLIGAAALFGGVAALFLCLRALLLRFAPRWMAGPGGLLIDTRGRLGLLQMRERHDRWPDGGGGGDGGCD